MLNNWLAENYVTVRPPDAGTVARRFLHDQQLPADEASVKAVIKQLSEMYLLMGFPGLKTPTRLVRISCNPS